MAQNWQEQRFTLDMLESDHEEAPWIGVPDDHKPSSDPVYAVFDVLLQDHVLLRVKHWHATAALALLNWEAA